MDRNDRSEKSQKRTLLQSVARVGLGRFFLFGFTGLWVVGITVPLALFCVSHLVALPIARTPVTLSSNAEKTDWRIVHVLSEECVCSQGVLEYLKARGTVEGREEEVVLVNSSETMMKELRSLGYAATLVEAESFCGAFGAEGVPFFQVLDKDSLKYSGAYFDGVYREGSAFLDLPTLKKLADGRSVKERPVYGCPTSKRLRTLLDPFGFRFEK